MNLTKANIGDLKKVTVKIECANGAQGSGTIVSVEDFLYVLTAAHVIESDNQKDPLFNEQIGVSITLNSQRFGLFVEQVVFYNLVTDAAVLRVSKPEGMPTSGMEKVRLLTSRVSGPGELCCFHKGELVPKHYAFENRGDTSWAIVGIELKLQRLEAIPNFEGTSGGGIFYEDTIRNLYLAGYMTKVGRYDGNNNEFICQPSTNFLESGLFDSIVDSRDYDYISDSGLASSVENGLQIRPLDKSGYEVNQTEFFIQNWKTKEIITKLRDDEIPTILLTALSGMGKTKLIYEAFKDTERMPNRYYAKYGGNREQLLGELKEVLLKNKDSDGIVIVDDCPVDLVPDVINYRNKYNNLFRLIFVNHDYFNEELARVKNYEVIRIKPQEMEERIGQYISEELGEDEHNKNDVAEIKKLADGYPQMAIELVQAYKEQDTTDPEAVAHLMPKLLSLTPGNEKQETAIWQTFSLCMPFPYNDATHEGFKYLVSNNHITPLGSMEYESRRSLAAQVVNKFSPTLIDVIGQWLYVRPFPLAVWLTSEWFKNVCNTPIHFSELIEGIRKQPEWLQNAISEGFCKHIQQMSGNKEAFKMVEMLVNADVGHPFFNEENLCSGLGSKLFLAMSTVNPASIASCLRSVLGTKEIGWLKREFIGDCRRNIVWALERLCFAAESYQDAITVLIRLAIAENEDISNNATGQLIQLFHIALAGTEVGLKDRLVTLKHLINDWDNYPSIVLRCFDSAFRNGGFSKMGGAEKFGFENKKDYTPKTWKEVYEYWFGCRDLLLGWIDEKPEVADLVAEMVESNVFGWARGGQKAILVPLMERISEIKEYHWESGYDALAKVIYTYSIDQDALGVTELMARLKSDSFICKLKEARFILNGKYHLGDKELREVTEGLFEPLAKEFLEHDVVKNETEVGFLLDDQDYIPIEFVRRVVTEASDFQLDRFFKTILAVVKTKPDKYTSPFLGNLSYAARERTPLMVFLSALRDASREMLYVSLMAKTENGDLSHFFSLVAEQKSEVLKEDFLPVYLRSFRTVDKDSYLKLLRSLRDFFPERPNDLVAFVGSERFIMRSNESPETIEIVKQALLDFHITDDYDRMLYDYSHLLIEVLQRWHDDEFAMRLNQKMIEVYNTRMVHLSMEGVFTELLKHYYEVIWEDFVSALLGDDTFLFYYQVKDELGAGFGFGKGPLFELNEELIKQLCLNHPETAPFRIAAMVPCFDFGETGIEASHFSKWVLWLLDMFGAQKDVRDAISSNLGSFTWTGDVSPYYERNIKCFGELLSHPIREVREWAQQCIERDKELLSLEKSKEDFMKIRYGL